MKKHTLTRKDFKTIKNCLNAELEIALYEISDIPEDMPNSLKQIELIEGKIRDIMAVLNKLY